MAEGLELDRSSLERVLDLFVVARKLADPTTELGRRVRERLVLESGLSREGVELALAHHLETGASESELASFIRSAKQAPRASVVLSANVCTSALRAIAFGLATAPRVFVKPSRRDPVLAELVTAEFSSLTRVTDTESALAPLEPGDELHVYGHDATVAALAREASSRGLVFRGHGAGFGVALVARSADLEKAAAALARDLVPFDGRGCLSPRLALVEGDGARACEFARFVHAELSRWGTRVPRGALTTPEREELVLYRRAQELIGQVAEGEHHLVACDPEPQLLSPAPPHRAVGVAPIHAEVLAELLGPWSSFITTLGLAGSTELLEGLALLAPHARRSELGSMQTPPFDGPVDLRTQVGTKTWVR